MLEKTKNVIRDERVALGLTQKEFANFVGIKYATFKQFEQTGKISLENFFLILKTINKDIEFNHFLNSFEFHSAKQRVNKSKKLDIKTTPIVSPLQKQIVLDKDIFGHELFYSVQNGHIYNISNFIPIVLKNCDDKNMMLLIKYFGEDRIKPYILKEKNIELLKMYNKHVQYKEKKIKC